MLWRSLLSQDWIRGRKSFDDNDNDSEVDDYGFNFSLRERLSTLAVEQDKTKYFIFNMPCKEFSAEGWFLAI